MRKGQTSESQRHGELRRWSTLCLLDAVVFNKTMSESRPRRATFRVVFLVCALQALLCLAGEVLPVGQIVNLTVSSDASQSYALYLPKDYASDKKWPILYCYDPLARGRAAVEKFQAAAEKFGVIVAGSNNSRNGVDAVPIAQNLWKDTHSRLTVDDTMVYAAGFSGGARVASVLAYHCEHCIAGVILSGAGFSTDLDTSSAFPSMVFEMVGTDDFNFPEMKTLDQTLKENGTIHHLHIFSGTHEWRPVVDCTDALQWMQLQAMKKGIRAKDASMIEEAFTKSLNRATSELAGNNAYEGYLELQALVSDFQGLQDTAEIEKQLAKAQKSVDLTKEATKEKEQFQRQEDLVNEIMRLGSGMQNPQDRLDKRNQLRGKISGIKKDADRTSDDDKRRMARRVLNEVLIACYEAASLRWEPQKNYDLALLNLEIAAEIKPDNPDLYFERARLSALKGDKKKALELLEESIKKGFNDATQLREEEAFAPLRDDPAFKKLVAGSTTETQRR